MMSTSFQITWPVHKNSLNQHVEDEWGWLLITQKSNKRSTLQEKPHIAPSKQVMKQQIHRTVEQANRIADLVHFSILPVCSRCDWIFLRHLHFYECLSSAEVFTLRSVSDWVFTRHSPLFSASQSGVVDKTLLLLYFSIALTVSDLLNIPTTNVNSSETEG